MYTHMDFKTKKQLVEAVKARMAWEANNSSPVSIARSLVKPIHRPPPRVTIYNPGPVGLPKENGTEYVEGPHYPRPHTWYAQVEMKDGQIIKVK